VQIGTGGTDDFVPFRGSDMERDIFGVMDQGNEDGTLKEAGRRDRTIVPEGGHQVGIREWRRAVNDGSQILAQPG